MRRSLAWLAILLLAAGSALAAPSSPYESSPVPRRGMLPVNLDAPPFTSTRQDTAWFGGDNGSGVAYLGGIWDFETPGSNGFQGCRSIDRSTNPGDYFGRVTASDFTAHGDPCTPMMLGTTGQLWCGIHQDEADLRDFPAGMGYQNLMCQNAFSPIYTSFDPATQAIDLAFSYFNHSEPGYDYAYVYVLCYDATGEMIAEHLVAGFTGVIGDAQMPAHFDEGVEVPAHALPAATTKVQLQFRMTSDGGWSDEDGLWDSPCGPFAADDVVITVGTATHTYDFNDGAQGWTFSRCEGAGTYMHIVHDYEYQEWLDDLGVTCDCWLTGDAVAFVGTTCQSGPGLVPGQWEQFETGPVPRAGYPAPYWNTLVVGWDDLINLPLNTGANIRARYRVYPYTTAVNPVPHWSPLLGDPIFIGGLGPYCSTGAGTMASMQAEWDSVKLTYEVVADCNAFSIPPSACLNEGCTGGSPVIDNFRVGFVHSANAPAISLINGGLFIDGFGQNYPTYLEPSDRCNANIARDLSMNDPLMNDWHGDSSVVVGPQVSSQASRFLCEMCFKVARLGARQNMIPEYHAWKARLASDPEENFVCVLMDSLETNNHLQVWNNKFYSYFHEDAVGYGGSPDYGPQNEILPDQIWVPGTRIEYYYRSYWFNGGAPPSDYYVLGYPPGLEMEFLPGMEVRPGDEYTVQWPSMLYIDAFNGGGERYMLPALEQLGIPFDKFDYTDNGTNWKASFKRDFGGTTHNPGGYGNNGCTTEQLLGYRLILWSNGTGTFGTCEPEDFDLFAAWLETTSCGLASIRRGIIFDGDFIAAVMADDVQGLAIDFCHNVLGTTLVGTSYRDHNMDSADCVYLEPVDNPEFAIAEPGDALYGNGCPQENNYNVLGVQPGVAGALGNLEFWSYEHTGIHEFVDFAQVVRIHQQTGVANWRSVVNGFSFHHLAQRGCGGEPCATDSACIAGGTSNLYGPMLEWLAEGATPFAKWTYPCYSTGVENGAETHLGMVNHLYQSRPNPFHTRATIRFSLAAEGDVTLVVLDVAGRLVKTLLDGRAPAGESSVVWDGTDSNGHRVGGGVFWTQMTTRDGYASGKKILVMP
jgi:hypothetical protein